MLRSIRKPFMLGGLLLVLGLFAHTANAQFAYGGGSGSVRSAGPMVSLVDFSFQPAQAPDVAFAFEDPAFGVFYRREGFLGRLIRGASSASDGSDLTMLEGSVDAWAVLRFNRSAVDSGFDLYFPIGFHGDYRKVTKKDENVDGTVFEVSVVALGLGLGLDMPVGSGVLSARSKPFFGLASRAFGTETGSSAGVSVDLDLSLPEISSRLGAYIGWGFRWQRWLMNASAVFAATEADNVEYRSATHSLQVGLTF